MNSDSTSLDHQLLTLLQAVRDTHDTTARTKLNDLLRTDPTARSAMSRLLVDEHTLIHRLRDDSIISLLDPAPAVELAKTAFPPRWYAWRPLTAAAAGLLFGMFCTSMVFGFVVQRSSLVDRIPLSIFDPSFENKATSLDDGLPRGTGQWGADSALLVSAETHATPLHGQHMLRLEPIPRDKAVKNHTSRVYQVLDLRSLPIEAVPPHTEVQITAAFLSMNKEVSSRYLIRAIALDESPETATKDFWSKTESDSAASVSQRFDTIPGDNNWLTFSLRMPLPRGAKTLVLIFGAVPPEDASIKPTIHYLDDVQVSLLKTSS